MPRNPQDFIRFLARHYPLVARLCHEHQRFTTDAEIEAYVRPLLEPAGSPALLVGRMKALGVLIQTTAEWAPPPFLGRFLAEVEQRHALASPGVVRGWVEKLAQVASSLDALSVSSGSISAETQMEIGGLLDEAADTISVIAMTVTGNCDRIGVEVGRYRAEEDARRMRFRLKRLISLHTEYLEPLLRLIDIDGAFYRVAGQVVAACDRISVGTLYDDDDGVSVQAAAVARHVVWLRRGTLRQAQEAHRELGPLCEAALRESTIARGVNRALDAIASGHWEKLELDQLLAVVSSPDGPLLSDASVGVFLLAARSHREDRPPLLGSEEPGTLDLPWTAASMREAIEREGEIEDLLEWICDRVGRDRPDAPAALLHELVEAAPECVSVAGTAARRYSFARLDLEGRVWRWRDDRRG